MAADGSRRAERRSRFVWLFCCCDPVLVGKLDTCSESVRWKEFPLFSGQSAQISHEHERLRVDPEPERGRDEWEPVRKLAHCASRRHERFLTDHSNLVEISRPAHTKFELAPRRRQFQRLETFQFGCKRARWLRSQMRPICLAASDDQFELSPPARGPNKVSAAMFELRP